VKDNVMLERLWTRSWR